MFFSLLLGLAILLNASFSHAEKALEPHQNEVQEIERRLSTEMEKLDELDMEEKKLLTKLAGLEAEAAETRRAVSELEKKIREAESEKDMLREKLADLERLSMAAERKISKKLVELYKYGRVRYATVMRGVANISEFLRLLKYLGAVMDEERNALIGTAVQVRTYQEEIGKVRARLTKVRDVCKDELARLTSLKKELEKKVLLLVKIHEEKEFYETSIQELRTAAEDLGQALAAIEKKDTYQTTNQPCHFEDVKGKLRYPMPGMVRKDAGPAQPSRAGSYRGIVIEGTSSSDVKAVFPGKVVFSGILKGYGELVIINHGSRFFTISAHLSERAKIEGDVVEAGEIIGRVGAKDASSGARLYFEIRKAAKGLNPQEWLEAR